MEFHYAISLVFEAHLPFIREYRKEDDLSQAGEEGRFFEYITETLLPFLEILEKLENDHVPFRIAVAISPILCHMLNDEHLRKKYLFYLDKQIEFGAQELERTADMGEMNKLAQYYLNRITDMKTAYTEKYEKNILKAFDLYRRKGKLEILASCATHSFLPFIGHNHESLQAQMEIPISVYRRHFGSSLQGFWLPALGWTPAIEPYLRAYNFSYTVVDSHSLLFGRPMPEKGCFYPVKTPDGTFVFARNFYAAQDIEKTRNDEIYRNNDRDAGYELPAQTVSAFLCEEGEKPGFARRQRTGYKYWPRSNDGSLYNPQAACERAAKHAAEFLEKTVGRLEESSIHMQETPLCLIAHNADDFGRFWYEWPQFMEALFRQAATYKDLMFINPSEYIFRQNISSVQVVTPEFSSCGDNGYAQTWLDVSNDWIYRHLIRSMERMTELAERFPDDTGLKERALNQAAREILLAQSSDWPAMLYRQDSTEYARSKAENSLRNFTTIYEALGSNYISTEWLTTLERRHNIFPNINYRVFRRKK
jgi:1,4-alpha-glucan branching enzyme